MKKIIALSAISLCIMQSNFVQAQDDVYDPPKQKEIRVKQSAPAPTEEKTVPYEEENSTSRKSPTYNNNQNNNYNNNGYNNNNGYSDNYSSDDWNYSYSDRLRRFHDPAVRFSYGWSVCNNSFYDPWNSYGFQPAYITPSWAYTYNDFYNPFWSSSAFMYDPWMYPSYSNYNPYYNNWYTPTCAAVIYNNYPYYGYGGYYGGGYEISPRNTYHGPRTGGYSNTNSPRGSNYSGSTNTNNSGYQNTRPQNNNPQSAPSKRWNQGGNNSNTYRYSNPNRNNQGTPRSEPAPSNNGGWERNNNSNNSGTGGVRIGTRPK